MADPVGILGLTGTVEQLVRLTRDLINSHKALKENTPAAQRLLTTYQELESMLTAVSADSFRGAKASHVKTVKHELDTLTRIFTSAQQEVQSKTTSTGNWASQYLSALKENERIAELEADADKIRQCIFKVSSDENINWRLSNMSQVAQEKCCPRTWAERNLTSVCIDLDAKDEKGQPSTCESKLKEAVLRDGRETHVGAVAMGQGGVGKTCTLRAIAYDHEIGKRFRGVYFLSLGMDATVGTIIQQLCMAVKSSGGAKLANKLQMEDNLSSVVAEVQEWLKEDASLFIIDDVWVRNGIDAKVLQSLSALVGNVCREGSRRSRILYSTRDPKLFGFGETITFKARDARGDRALEILLKVAEESRSAYDDAECQVHIEAILDKCAGLPLALHVAGSAVRLMRERWKGDTRGAWKKYSEMMNEADGFEIEDGSDVYAYPSVYKMLHSSIKVLDGTISKEEKQKHSMTFQKMHRALCVMKKQDWVPCCILQHLWGMVDEVAAERAVKQLESVGAAELQYQDGMGGVRLHDLTQDFARREAKKHDEMEEWHRKLLDKYRTNDGLVAHTSLSSVNEKEKQYVFENVYRLCQEAGLYKEMCSLLQSSRWVSSVVQNGTLWVMEQAVQDMTDEEAGASGSEAVAEEKRWLDDDSKFGVRKIAKAARLFVPYLNGSMSNVFFQLYARLVEVSDKSRMVKRFLEDVERWAPKPWLKTIRGHFINADELLEEIHVGCVVAKVKFSSDGISGIGWQPSALGVMAFKHNRRTGMNVMTWDPTCDLYAGRDFELISVQNEKLKTAKRLLERLGAIFRSDCGCFQRDDENKELTCSDACEDLVAAGCSDGTILIGRFSTRTIERTIRAHARKISSICFSADGRRVVSGSDDKTVRVWDVATGAPVCEPLTGHRDRATCVAISADGRRVVSGSWDKTVRVWDVATGAPVCEPLTGHTRWVRSVAISADGKRVVSGSLDKTVRVWDVETGDRLLVTEGYKWDETIVLHCGGIPERGEATSSGEGGEYYYADCNAVKFRRANDREEILAQFDAESVYQGTEIDINSRKGVVAVAHPIRGVGIFRIIK